MSVDPSVIHASAAAGGDRYPLAEWRPLPENAGQSRIQPTQFIFHTEAGHGQTSNDASWKYWNRPDITIEAHFLLDMGGNMLQAMGVFTRADNNARANARAVSIETQDLGGDSVEVTPWTPEQIEQLAGLVAWLHLHPQINLPLEQCLSWSAPGYGGHYLFPEWSIYKGKTCPGATRRMQIPQVIARAWAIINWRNDTPVEHFPTTEDEVLAHIIIEPGPDGQPVRNAEFWANVTMNQNGEPHVMLCWWGGPGGGAETTFKEGHQADTNHIEMTASLDTMRKYWILLGDPAQIQDSKHPNWVWDASDFYTTIH